ncbi:MAG: glycogen/starch synthase [Alphaproteobacteria bacterium]|nr:glycogen/starch synthase [Alphaproteobacteria bacterium]
MKVIQVACEFAPFVKVGGLADVIPSLLEYLPKIGIETRLLIPAYPKLREIAQDVTEVQHDLPWLSLEKAKLGDYTTYLFDWKDGRCLPDNPYEMSQETIATLCWVAAHLYKIDPSWTPDVVHCHDWQTALAAAYLAAIDDPCKPRSVLTIHNLIYQGLYPADSFKSLGLPDHFWSMNGLEYYGNLSFLKGGIYFADAITTVSPTYAQEIQKNGFGMEGLLETKKESLFGILNGVDSSLWSPETDPQIEHTYTAETIKNRKKNKVSLQKELGLPCDEDAFLWCVVSRVSHEKGIRLILNSLSRLPGQGILLLNDASADSSIFIPTELPDTVKIYRGLNERLARRLFSSAVLFLMPSYSEPCGLTQLYAMKYGAVPLVRPVGGLKDTIVPCSFLSDSPQEDIGLGNGFYLWDDHYFVDVVWSAFHLWQDSPKKWNAIQKNGMMADYSWEEAALKYQHVYQL